jgi:hypothetical protein
MSEIAFYCIKNFGSSLVYLHYPAGDDVFICDCGTFKAALEYVTPLNSELVTTNVNEHASPEEHPPPSP